MLPYCMSLALLDRRKLERGRNTSKLTRSRQTRAPLRRARRRRVDLAPCDICGGRAGARADVDGLTVARSSRRPGLDVHRPGLELAPAPVGNRIGFVEKNESLLCESHWGSSCGKKLECHPGVCQNVPSRYPRPSDQAWRSICDLLSSQPRQYLGRSLGRVPVRCADLADRPGHPAVLALEDHVPLDVEVGHVDAFPGGQLLQHGC